MGKKFYNPYQKNVVGVVKIMGIFVKKICKRKDNMIVIKK
jgi:hypothetical protein